MQIKRVAEISMVWDWTIVYLVTKKLVNINEYFFWVAVAGLLHNYVVIVWLAF